MSSKLAYRTEDRSIHTLLEKALQFYLEHNPFNLADTEVYIVTKEIRKLQAIAKKRIVYEEPDQVF